MIQMHYLVNKNAQISTGDHKIHKENCKMKPNYENTIELGDFYNSNVAQYEAKKYYISVNGCKYCCAEIYLKK